jgi:hypothetical protein
MLPLLGGVGRPSGRRGLDFCVLQDWLDSPPKIARSSGVASGFSYFHGNLSQPFPIAPTVGHPGFLRRLGGTAARPDFGGVRGSVSKRFIIFPLRLFASRHEPALIRGVAVRDIPKVLRDVLR